MVIRHIEIAPDAGECPDRSHGEHYWVDNFCSCGVQMHETKGSIWYSYSHQEG